MGNGNGYPTCCPGDLVLSANKGPHMAVLLLLLWCTGGGVAGEDGTGREHGVNRRNRNRQIGKQTLKQTENLKFSSSPTLMWSTLVHVSILRIMDALIDISPWGAVGRRRWTCRWVARRVLQSQRETSENLHGLHSDSVGLKAHLCGRARLDKLHLPAGLGSYSPVCYVYGI